MDGCAVRCCTIGTTGNASSAPIGRGGADRACLAGVVSAGDGVQRAGVDGLALDGGVALEAALDGVHLRHLVEDDVQDLLAHFLDAGLEHPRDLLKRGCLAGACVLAFVKRGLSFSN